tara:strand:- start:23461 stop:25134 length:1674 start_codon:yes stop_codon:yes gene_type:complete
MILASFAEVLSIGAVIPFLTVFSNPEVVQENLFFKYFINFFGINENANILLIFTLIFVTAVIFSGLFRLMLMRFSIRLSYATGADIGAKIYEKTLYMPYQDHISSNSSEIINGISKKTDLVIDNIILQVTNLISSFFLLSIILTALLFIDTYVAISSLSGFAFIYLTIIYITRNKLQNNSKNVAEYTTRVVKILQESLGGIKNLIIGGTQQIFFERFRFSDLSLRGAQGSTSITVQSPKFLMEATGMSLIALIAYFFNSDKQNIIPILGALALGAQRLLPILQQAYSAWSSIRGAEASLEDILDLLKRESDLLEEKNTTENLEFLNKIKFIKVNFKYKKDSKEIFKKIDFEIPKGSRVGFVGETGSGKSTLLDLISGLLKPSDGDIFIDDKKLDKFNMRAWQNKISFVPQDIFLVDDSVKENIIFGSHKIFNQDKLNQVIEISQLSSFINSLPKKIDTYVGERGSRLSGGQLQRIGIARALYNDSEILILDEATSALDDKTELDLMEEINKLDKNLTILIIAHRLSSLKNCSLIFEINNGIIKHYSNLIEYQNTKKI